jgi:predicted Zn-dependent peptidase
MKGIRKLRMALLAALCLPLLGASFIKTNTNSENWVQLSHPRGLTVFHLHTPEAQTLSLRFCVFSASLYDAAAPALDRLLFSLMPIAGAEISRQDLDQIKDGGGILISGQSGLDFSQLSVAATKNEAERAVAILSSLIQNPSQDEGLYQEIRAQAINDLLWQEGQVYDAFSRGLKKTILSNHPYGSFFALEASLLSEISLTQVLAHHRKIMAERHIFIVSCGPQTVSEMERIIRINFPMAQNIERGNAPFPAFPKPPAGQNTLHLFPHRSASIPYLKAEYPAPGPGNADYPASLVMTRVLSEMLMESVRTDRGLVYSVWSSAAARRRAGNGEIVLYRCRDIQEGVTAIRETILRLQGKTDTASAYAGAKGADPDFEEAVQAAKNQIISALATQNITPRDRSLSFASWYAASGEKSGIGGLWEEVASIRAEDVRALARRNFADMHWGITYPPGMEPPALKWKLHD